MGIDEMGIETINYLLFLYGLALTVLSISVALLHGGGRTRQKDIDKLERSQQALERSQAIIKEDVHSFTSEIMKQLNPLFGEVNARLGKIETVLMNEKKSD